MPCCHGYAPLTTVIVAVLALDIDPVKVDLTQNNCAVYGVDMQKVSVTKDDFYAFAERYESASRDSSGPLSMPHIDVVFLSPPWGGQDYLVPAGDKQDCSGGAKDAVDIVTLLAAGRRFRPSTIMLYLPRNTDEDQLRTFLRPGETVEIVRHQARYKKSDGKKVKAVTAVFRCQC